VVSARLAAPGEALPVDTAVVELEVEPNGTPAAA
jgi:hypothetical protein